VLSDTIHSGATHWLALALMAAAIAAACGAAMSRSLFSVVMFVAVASALASAALLALSAAQAALDAALLGVGLAPMVLLAALLLSTRTTKSRRAGRPWLTLVAACAAGAAMLAAAPEFEASAPVAGPAGSVTLWLAQLAAVAVFACVGLLGFGERGALEPHDQIERTE
jgi:hypothetical protein